MTRAAYALTTVGVVLGATVLPSAPAQATSAPVVSKLADINLNLGMTTRVTVPATGATSYEWWMWTSSKGWILLAKGGTGYQSINFTGDATRHMGVLQVTAINASGSVKTNLSRIRVWGISSSYPAKAGSKVRTGGWELSISGTTYEYAPTVGTQARLTATKLALPAAVPWEGTQLAYVDSAGASHGEFGRACTPAGYRTPGVEDIGTLGAGESGSGYICAPNVPETSAANGRWTIKAKAGVTAAVGPVAWFKGF